MMSLNDLLAYVETNARLWFQNESHPWAIIESPRRPELQILALDVGVGAAIRRVAETACTSAALLVEAYGAAGEDIIGITVDHPDGLRLGRIDIGTDVNGERTFATAEWTTEVVQPTRAAPVRFPPFTSSGKIVFTRIGVANGV